jgi:hypothetical protein
MANGNKRLAMAKVHAEAIDNLVVTIYKISKLFNIIISMREYQNYD